MYGEIFGLVDFLLESLHCKNSRVSNCICNEFTTKLASLGADFLKPLALGVKQGESRLSPFTMWMENTAALNKPLAILFPLFPPHLLYVSGLRGKQMTAGPLLVRSLAR